MLFSTVLFLASLSAFSSLAAPVPGHLRARAADGGWPSSLQDNDAKSSFGISGGFKQSYIGTGPEHETVLIGHYPKGSYAGSKSPGPGISGFIFEASGGPHVDLANAKEARLTYKLKFEPGFDFQLAGKLPGLYGGNDTNTAKTCAGGNHNDNCWSARLMWREHGAGELYGYLPSANQRLAVCKGKCDVKYGASIGTGNFKFTPNEWTELSERVKLNDVGKMNGEIEVFQNNQSKILVTGLQLRGSKEGRIAGAMIHTFFGGSSKTAYASPKDQNAYFKDFKIDVIHRL
ncbi:hypothetical protein C0995_014884 [Termitomyces sp. Mi166|nr:hypothetical protein C0995_014884 [Termitomyces sp. Mi166\